MREEFEPRYDKRLSMVVFVRQDDRLSIELVAKSKEKAIELEEDILSACRIYDMSPPSDLSLTAKQNFEVECDEVHATLTLSGNLFNAFKLLQARDIITGEFSEEILKNNEVKIFLESTKSFITEVSSEEMEESPRTAMERAATLRTAYLAALMELQPEELEQSVTTLAEELAKNGKDLLEVKTQASRNSSPKVY